MFIYKMSSNKKTREIVRGVRKVSKKKEKEEEEEERQRRICTSLNESSIPSLSESKCNGVSDMNGKWFEARCACIYQYLSQETPIVYTPYLIVPIILSFSNNKDLVEDVLYNCYKNIEETKDAEYQKIGRSLIECNKRWNQSLNSSYKNRVKNSLHIEHVLGNPKFNQTLLHTQFLEEILGVIDKKGYMETKTNKYILDAYVKDINEKFDKKCKISTQEECQSDENCILRTTSTGLKQCGNRQRYRNGINPNDPTSYYLFVSPFNANALIVFKPLSKKYIISGYCGIFRQYDVEEIVIGKETRTREIATDRYTITFPPFGGGFGPMIRGFNSFLTAGYIKDYQTRDGETVGIHEGLYNKIQDWFVNEFLPLEIDRSSQIYIVGCSLGAALTNIASFFLMNEGYEHIHFYAHGSPRVGDERLREYMENAPFEDDSYNYVRINNVVNMMEFYTEFDPVCKFPVKHERCYMPGRCLNFANNSRLRGFAGGIIFGIEMLGFEQQKDFNMVAANVYDFVGFDGADKDIIHARSCLFSLIHSVPAYSANTINGELTGDGDTDKYNNQFDAIRNIDFDEKCGDLMKEVYGKNKKSYTST